MNKILIVDDDENILDAVSLLLESYGYTVDTTYKGQETYDKVKAFNPNLILLDVLMSGQDGRTICRNLKADTKTKHIPIIMISAHPSAREHSVQVGADDFLAKPFDSGDLLGKIRKLTDTKN